MLRSEDSYNKRRLKSSYLTTVVSISLVLFMLGFLAMILYHSSRVSDYVKENIGFSVIMNEGVKDARILALQSEWNHAPFVRATRLVTREEAAQSLKKELGEDFIGFLGYNPLLPSIEIRLKASWANNDSIPAIEKKFMANKEVKEVVYQKSLIGVVNENLRRISLIILTFSGLLLIISIALINNTIRLAVYSKRFLIKTMQLVGATESFIRKPFLLSGIIHGFYGAIAALVMLSGILYLAKQQFPDLIDLKDATLYLTLFGIVSLLGIVISYISTFIAVRKYLRIKTEYLY